MIFVDKHREGSRWALSSWHCETSRRFVESSKPNCGDECSCVQQNCEHASDVAKHHYFARLEFSGGNPPSWLFESFCHIIHYTT